MKQLYYINYSWVSKNNPSDDYGTETEIIETNDIKVWWDRTRDRNYNGDEYIWTLNGVARL